MVITERPDENQRGMTLEDVFANRGRVRVLRLIIDEPNLNVNQISLKLKMSTKTVRCNIDLFLEQDLVLETDSGTSRGNTFSLNEDSVKAFAFKNLSSLFPPSHP